MLADKFKLSQGNYTCSLEWMLRDLTTLVPRVIERKQINKTEPFRRN